MDFERLYMNGKINVQKGNSWAIVFFASSNVYNHQVSARTNSCCSKKAKLFSPQLARPARIRERRGQNELEDDYLLIYLLSPTRQ